MQYDSTNLRFRANRQVLEDGLVTRVTTADAGWDLLNMEVRRLHSGQQWDHHTDECESLLVILGGSCSVRSNRGTWTDVGKRPNVFAGMPYALYLPRKTEFSVTASSANLEVAHAWVATNEDHPAALVTPDNSTIEVRGGRNATRQINSIVPPGFDCHRLVACEVYTPGGNWSSYPPHKHDTVRHDATNTLIEADLEEFYYYKMAKPEGYALQRIYTDDRSIDAAVIAHDNDIVLVPEGYHPVSAAYGYDCYYLNFLAGSHQSLAATDDPAFAWTKDTWDQLDPRIPLVHHDMQIRSEQ